MVFFFLQCFMSLDISVHDMKTKFLCITSFHFDIFGLCSMTEWVILFIHLDLSSPSPSHLMAEIPPNWSEWKLWTIKSFTNAFKHAECCIWSHRNEGKKVTGLRLFEHRNMSEVIYTPVLTRPWVMDFHSELEKAAACSEVNDS